MTTVPFFFTSSWPQHKHHQCFRKNMQPLSSEQQQKNVPLSTLKNKRFTCDSVNVWLWLSTNMWLRIPEPLNLPTMPGNSQPTPVPQGQGIQSSNMETKQKHQVHKKKMWNHYVMWSMLCIVWYNATLMDGILQYNLLKMLNGELLLTYKSDVSVWCIS